MLDLPLVSQPFPDDRPWFDLSQYLAPGLSPRAGSMVGAQLDGNTLTFAARITVDPLVYPSEVIGSGYVLLKGLPPELTVGADVISYADFAGASSQVVAGRNGTIVIPTRTGQDPKLVKLIGFTITGPRSK